jgi:hypothetical protein
MDQRTLEICRRWDDFCARLFHAYQDLALAEAGEPLDAAVQQAKEPAGR